MIKGSNRLKTVQEYYFSKKLREVANLIKSGKPIINMGIGSPDLFPSKSIIDVLKNSLTDQNAHKYQSYQGLLELREAISKFYLKFFNVQSNPINEVLPLMGSKEGIMHISMAFLNPRDQVLIPNPGYPTYASVTRLMEAEPIFYPLSERNNWQPDFELLNDLDTSKVKIMWVNYPHMPTGTDVDIDTFDRLITWAKEREVLLVNDNPYSFLLTERPQSILSRPGSKEVALELNSLSKSFNMAGWRVGMLSGKASTIQAVLKVKSNMDSGMFFGIQQGGIAALKMDTSWFTELNGVYLKRRALVEKLAIRLGAKFEPNSVGLFVWAKLPEGVSDSEAYINKILNDKHVFITPGTIFGSQGEGYIRFSLCVNEQTIEEVLKRFDS